ncbi:MAG TPA: DNA repair protein RadA, partial [Lachnoclostridium phytofermentans]|nr:DNA repair protein RadA [Lachnoclostridium phytofermentans]
MAKKSTVFFCKECGFESAKWVGQCPGCKTWNSFTEEPVVKKTPANKVSSRKTETPKYL